MFSEGMSTTMAGSYMSVPAEIDAADLAFSELEMELQKEKSKTYETVETWTSSKTGTVLAMSESRNINVLCKYRLKVTFTAGKETEVVYKY